MTPANEYSVQDRLGEELGLLPGRISRTFYLLATLDAQASYVNSNVQNTRAQLLDTLNTQPATTSTASSAIHQLSALRQLHQVQRQLLIDKLFVDTKASEWVARAKTVASRYSQGRSRCRSHSNSNSGVIHYDAAANQMVSSSAENLAVNESAGAAAADTHRKRYSMSAVPDEDVDQECSSAGHGGGASSCSVTGNQKRRRVSASGDFMVPLGRPVHRRSYRAIHGPHSVKASSRLGTSEVGRNPTTTSHRLGTPTTTSKLPTLPHLPAAAAGGTFTVKLGSSQQKGRPRKSSGGITTTTANNKLPGAVNAAYTNGKGSSAIPAEAAAVEEAVVPVAPVVGNEVIEEYFCPICNKSDYEDPAMVACDACDQWYHCRCVGFQNLEDAESSGNFYCQNCSGSKDLQTGEDAIAAAPPSPLLSRTPTTATATTAAATAGTATATAGTAATTTAAAGTATATAGTAATTTAAAATATAAAGQHNY